MTRFFIFALLLFHSWTFAAVVPDKYYQASLKGKPITSKTDYTAVCKAYVAGQSGITYYFGGATLVDPNVGSNKVACYFGPSPTSNRQIVEFFGYYQCSTSAPYINEQTGLCSGTAIDPCGDKLPMIRKFYYTSKGPYIAPDHFGACQIAPDKMLVCRTDATGTYCMWQIHRTGETWSGNESPGNGGSPDGDSSKEVVTDPRTNSPPIRNPASKPDICPTCIPCPAGSMQAGIDADGVPLCVGSGSNPDDPIRTPPVTTKPPVTSTGSDGTVTTVQDTVQTNADGSTTTTTTTTVTKPDGTKTVTVGSAVSNTPSGGPGKTDTPNADQANLCKQNPQLTICRNSTVSGTCGETTCTGDAIQCATLRAAAALQCQQKKDADDLKASPLHTLGSAAASGADPAASTLPSASKAEVVTMPSIEGSQGWLGSGSYFRDKTVQLPGGKQLVIPLSQGQDVMIALRYVTIIVCSLVCFGIIRSTFTSSSGV